MSSLTLIAALLIAVPLVVFGTQDTQAVTFYFLMFKAPSAPIVLGLFAAALVGAFPGWIVSGASHFRRMREHHELQVTAHERADAAAALPMRHATAEYAGSTAAGRG